MSGLPGYQRLCCAELGGHVTSRHGNLMLDALCVVNGHADEAEFMDAYGDSLSAGCLRR